MPKIKLLDEVTINKIAAGEVIERPVSIVKELVENSLDAGAQNIVVRIENGGKKLILVTDDGQGIEKEDLLLAPRRHATSKIQKLEDIYQVFSMGFRGEALSSIGHVAKLEIISRTKDAEGYRIEALEDYVSQIELVSHQVGTTVKVQDLFLKVPVRRKYLKTDTTEFSYIYEVMQRYALIYPEKNLVLYNDGKEILNSHGLNTQEILLYAFFGKNLKDKILRIDEEYEGCKLKGWVSAPNLTFNTRNKQFFSVNKRIIKSAGLRKAVADSYKDYISSGRFPLVLLDICLAPDLLDINIHPQKQEVKFLNTTLMYKAVRESLKNKFRTSSALDQFKVTQDSISPKFYLKENMEQSAQGSLSRTEDTRSWSAPKMFADQDVPQENKKYTYFQIFENYLVVKGVEGIWILDQHAAHERILYEKFKENSKSNRAQQPLLLAEVVDLTELEIELFDQYKAVFAFLDIDIESFGRNQLVIRQVPVDFLSLNAGEWVLKVLEELKTGKDVQEDDILREQKDKLQRMACRAAIKAGKKMKPEEVGQLIADFQAAPSNFTCPHGRPIFIKISKPDLEKLFLRR